MKNEKLKQVLQLHEKWLEDYSTGQKADLRGAKIRDADLHRVDLHNVDLHRANLCRVDLRGANLCSVDLRGANLHNVDLRGANMRGVDLHRANLHNVDLRGANLCRVDLHRANLRHADLGGANLRYVIGDGEKIKTVQDKWHIVYTEDVMAIGCQQHTLEDWFSFSDGRISQMAEDSSYWWKRYKSILKVLTGFEE